MRRITFIEHDGRRQIVDAADGQSLMHVATQHAVRGIVAECGGARVCGTCHCYIDEPWFSAIGAVGDDERMLLEFSEHQRLHSRLSCQVKVSAAVDGIIVRLPASQP